MIWFVIVLVAALVTTFKYEQKDPYQLGKGGVFFVCIIAGSIAALLVNMAISGIVSDKVTDKVKPLESVVAFSKVNGDYAFAYKTDGSINTVDSFGVSFAEGVERQVIDRDFTPGNPWLSFINWSANDTIFILPAQESVSVIK